MCLAFPFSYNRDALQKPRRLVPVDRFPFEHAIDLQEHARHLNRKKRQAEIIDRIRAQSAITL